MANLTSIVEFVPKVDNTDIVFAAHINKLQTEVALIENVLGQFVCTGPDVGITWDEGEMYSHVFSSVKERLDYLNAGMTRHRHDDLYVLLEGGSVVRQHDGSWALALRNTDHSTPALQIWGDAEPTAEGDAAITLNGYSGEIVAQSLTAAEMSATSTPIIQAVGLIGGSGKLLQLDTQDTSVFVVDRDGKATSQGNQFGGTVLPKLGLALSTVTGESTGLINVEAATGGSGNIIRVHKTDGTRNWYTKLTDASKLSLTSFLGAAESTTILDGETGALKLTKVDGIPEAVFSRHQGVQDVRMYVTGGSSEYGTGDLKVDASQVTLGRDGGSGVRLNGSVTMPNMALTYFYCEDKYIYIRKGATGAFNPRPDNADVPWTPMYSGASGSGTFDTTFTFVAPASGSVLCTLSAELHANASLSAVSYQVRLPTGAVHLDFGYAQSITHNAYTRENTDDVAYMSVSTPYHVNGLSPGATYVVEIAGKRWRGPTPGGFQGLDRTPVRDLRMYVEPLFSTVAVVR